MPQITKIEPQKRNKHRFTIHLDSGDFIGIGEYLVLKHNLKEGKELTLEDIRKIVLEENIEVCKQKAFDAIAKRPQSKSELRSKLKRYLSRRIKQDSLKEEIIKNVFKTLEKYDYVNDKKFAEWILEQRKKQLKGPLFIRHDLVKKGIDKEIIKQVLDKENFDKELKQAFVKMLKKTKKEKDIWKRKKKIYSYLGRQGFYLEDINRLLESI